MKKQSKACRFLKNIMNNCKYFVMDMKFLYFCPLHDAYLLRRPSFYLKYTQEERVQIIEEEVDALEKMIDEA